MDLQSASDVSTAIATTVPAWARASDKPEYSVGEITGAMSAQDVSDAIDGKVYP